MSFSRTSLLDLLPELRTMIYKYVLPEDICYVLPPSEMPSSEFDMYGCLPPRIEGVVFINKLTLREAGYLVLFHTRYHNTLIMGHGAPTAEVEASLARLYKHWCTHLAGRAPARHPHHGFRFELFGSSTKAHAVQWARAVHRLALSLEASTPNWEPGTSYVGEGGDILLDPPPGHIDGLKAVLAVVGRRSAEPWKDVLPDIQKMCAASGVETLMEKLIRLNDLT